MIAEVLSPPKSESIYIVHSLILLSSLILMMHTPLLTTPEKQNKKAEIHSLSPPCGTATARSSKTYHAY
jgi:hypothetical protein